MTLLYKSLVDGYKLFNSEVSSDNKNLSCLLSEFILTLILFLLKIGIFVIPLSSFFIITALFINFGDSLLNKSKNI